MGKLWKTVERAAVVAGLLCALLTLYFTAGSYYGWNTSSFSQPLASPVTAVIAPPEWLLISIGVLSLLLIMTGWTMMAVRLHQAARSTDEEAVELILEAKLYKAVMDPDDNETRFVLNVLAKQEIVQPRIYVSADEMRSGWSGQTPFWTNRLDGALIFDASVLHTNERKQIEIGQRLGRSDAPLAIKGVEFNRDNNSWPYARVRVTLNAMGRSKTRSFVVLAPGYVHNQILSEEQVPMSWAAIGPLSLSDLP